jgi:hypothetical protein
MSDRPIAAAQIAVLPGGDLVAAGLRDLARGAETTEALLVSIGASQLRELGLPVESPFPAAEHRLYERLRTEDEDGAHARYNALVRRLVSFEQAAAHVLRWNAA